MARSTVVSVLESVAASGGIGICKVTGCAALMACLKQSRGQRAAGPVGAAKTYIRQPLHVHPSGQPDAGVQCPLPSDAACMAAAVRRSRPSRLPLVLASLAAGSWMREECARKSQGRRKVLLQTSQTNGFSRRWRRSCTCKTASELKAAWLDMKHHTNRSLERLNLRLQPS